MEKIIRKAKKNIAKIKIQNGFFSRFNFLKLTESYTSLILGAIVVLIAGILFLSFARINRNTQTSSTMNAPKTWEEISQGMNTSSAYTVKPGDDLWTISENVYNDGFKWVEIAKLNNIKDPGQIEVGTKLSLPKLGQSENVANLAAATGSQNNTKEIVTTNSITGNSYVVVKDDNLWDIAVRAYGDGFKWVEIAKANKLVNPNLIHPGNQFIIPR